MKKPCLAFGAAMALAAHLSAAHAIDFKSAVVGQRIADRTLTIGKLSMQLPGGEWILAAKTQELGGSNFSVAPPPLQTFAAVQAHDKAISAILVFSAPAWSYNVSRWNDEPCKNVSSYIVKSTLNQTFAMPECFVIDNETAGSFGASASAHRDLVRWASSNGYGVPNPMVKVFHTKYHGGDFFRFNAYLAGGSGSAPAAEAWGREAVASLAAMVTRSTSQATLPELPAFVAAPAGAMPMASISPPVAGSAANAASTSAESRLRQLRSLLDSKLITPEEYEGKRKKIVEEL